jgi:tRNA modification GTPase
MKLYAASCSRFQIFVTPMPTLPHPSRDTIFAVATPPGKSALAVFRISGPQAGAALEAIAGGIPKPRVAALRRLRDPDSQSLLDEALVLWFPEPRSETGEDIAELQVHGSRAVIGAVNAALAKVGGLRMAEPGEFARRAFGNGKLDLTAVEGLADLIDAETEAQRRQALRQSSGALGRLYDGWREDIVQAMALMEAAIDFSDEGDVAATATDSARQLIQEKVLAPMRTHLDDGRRGEILRQGFRVVIAGPPNAGKSSLINALSRRDVAIVSPEAGTTRDVIEVALDLAGVPVLVSDTAGIRAAAGAVEQEGIRRTFAQASQANLVLWLVDAGEPAPIPGHAMMPDALSDLPVMRVLNKGDLVRDAGPEVIANAGVDLAISVATGEGLSVLVEAITERAQADVLSGADEAPVITQARHRGHVQDAVLDLEAYLAGDPHDVELRAEELRRAAQAIGRLTGRVDPEDVLDRLFSRFCIGK